MPDWAIWVVLAAGLIAAEALTLTFLLAPLGLAALAAAVAAGLGGGLVLEIGVFAAAAVASLAFVRPIAKKHLRTPPHVRTGTAALVGASALVLEEVDGDRGLVKLGGETWSARAFEDGRVFKPGDKVSVLKIEGATALVSD